MTLTLSFSASTEAKLKEQAAASGRDVAEYVANIVEKAVGSEIENGKLTTHQRAAQWRKWAESHPKVDHFVNDSRESIYDGRGE
jgi:hypothetical protein